jgi:hypothetical protein
MNVGVLKPKGLPAPAAAPTRLFKERGLAGQTLTEPKGKALLADALRAMKQKNRRESPPGMSGQNGAALRRVSEEGVQHQRPLGDSQRRGSCA